MPDGSVFQAALGKVGLVVVIQAMAEILHNFLKSISGPLPPDFNIGAPFAKHGP